MFLQPWIICLLPALAAAQQPAALPRGHVFFAAEHGSTDTGANRLRLRRSLEHPFVDRGSCPVLRLVGTGCPTFPIMVARHLCGNDNGDSRFERRANGGGLCLPMCRGRWLSPRRFNLPTT